MKVGEVCLFTNDGIERKTNAHNINIAFTVDDVDAEYERLKNLALK